MATEEECPLCMEEMELTDKACFPCTCIYQVCKFCWYRILLSPTPVCPGCRTLYDPELGLKQFQAQWIPVVETVRSDRLFGEHAFPLLQIMAYIDADKCFPISIINGPNYKPQKVEGILNLLEKEGLIVKSSTSFQIKKSVQHTIRRFSDEVSVLYAAVHFLGEIMEAQLPKDIETSYLAHAVTVWMHALNHDPILKFHTHYVSCLCDKLDENGLYQLYFEVSSKTFPKFRTLHGPTTVHALRIQSDFATALWRLNRLEESHTCFSEILPLAKTHLGEHHWLTLTVCNEVAFVMNKQGKNAEAVEIIEELCITTSTIYGPDHPDTITTFRNKGTIMKEMKRYEEALEAFYYVLEGQEKTSPGDKDALQTRFIIASILNQQKQYEEALKHHTLVLHARKNLLHPADKAILISSHETAATLNKLQRYQQALQICQDQATITNMDVTTLDVIRLECQTAKALVGIGRAKEGKLLMDKIRMKRESLLAGGNRKVPTEAIIPAKVPFMKKLRLRRSNQPKCNRPATIL